MGSIQASIDLQDNFTGVILNINRAVEISVARMEQMQAVMSEPVDTSSLYGVGNQVKLVADQVQGLDAAMCGISMPVLEGIQVPVEAVVTQPPQIEVPESIQVPVEAVVTQQPQIEVPEGIQVPVETVVTQPPQIEVPEGIQVPVEAVVTQPPQIEVPEGIQVPVEAVVTQPPQIEVPESIQVPVEAVVTQQPQIQIPEDIHHRMDILVNQLEVISAKQAAIREAAGAVYLLPEGTEDGIREINNEIVRMQYALDYLGNNPFQLDSSFAELQIQSISEGLDQMAEKQRRLGSALGNVDIRASALGQPPQIEVPEGIQIPLTWKTGNLDVFTGTGIERFQQEVQSANHMMEQLGATQDAIAKQAYNTNLFPPEAFRDLNQLAVRVDLLRGRIQQVLSNPVNMGTDTANAELEQLRGQLDQAVQEQEKLNHAIDAMDVGEANEAYLRLSQTIGGAERYIRDNVDEQGRFNREIEGGTQQASELVQTIKGAVAAYATIQTLQTALGLSDQLTSTAARLDLMNDGLQTTGDLQNMIFLSAERARGSYQATADAVSKLGLMAGDAFSSSEEIIAFLEQINKQFTIAGTGAAGIEAAMLQLTQAMGSGVLRGEEYNSILEQAPNIVQNISRYIEENESVLAGVAGAMGMTVDDLAGNVQGKMKDIASEGILSAELIKNAMFYAAEETNEKFESMPKTFTQIWTSFQNNAQKAFQPVLQRMNGIAGSGAFQGFVDGAIEALAVVAGITLEIFDFLGAAAGIVGENWSWLSPIVYGVAAALTVYYGAQLAANAISLVSKGIHTALAVAQMPHAAATGSLTIATTAGIAAQNGLNAAMGACPIMWIIILIIALITLFYAAVAAVNHFAGTSVSATGIICGVFMTALAFVGNVFSAAINFIIDLFVTLWNFIASFVNFLANVFHDPVGAIARLFFDLVDTVLSLLQSVASAIDWIFGSNLAEGLQGWRDSIGDWVEETYGSGVEIMGKVDADDLKLGRFEYRAAWDTGYSFGKGIDESIANFDLSSLFETEVPSPEDYKNLGNYGEELVYGMDNILYDTDKIADSMDITEESLKYLRDIAEQETVNRFTTAEIKIEQTNHNTISGKMDLDGVMDGLTEVVEEAAHTIAEGVYD